MAALMRSTNEETETNCKLVRDRDKVKRETVLKFEVLFEKWEITTLIG